MSAVKGKLGLGSGKLDVQYKNGQLYVREITPRGENEPEENEDLTLLISNKSLRKENVYLKEECKYLRKRLENLEKAISDGEIEIAKNLNKEKSFQNARMEFQKNKFNQELVDRNEMLENENYDLRNKLRRMRNRQFSASPIKDLVEMKAGKLSFENEMKYLIESPEENLMIRTFLLSIEIKRLHRLLRKMSNHCDELQKTYERKIAFESSQKNAHKLKNFENEDEMSELSNQLILQNERLVLKDKYIEEQRKLLEELQRKKEIAGKKLKSKYKDKELDFLEKINALKHQQKQMEIEFETALCEKDRQFEILNTKFENYKIVKGQL